MSLLIGGLIGFYFYTKSKNPGTTFFGQPINRTNFGGYEPNSNNQNNPNATTTDIIPSGTIKEVKIPKLRQITLVPTAGSDFTTTPVYEVIDKNIEPADLSVSKTNKPVVKKPRVVGQNTVIRYIERGTGHIYETSTSTLEAKRISNTTIPKIYEAYFTDKGDNLILRGLIGNSDIISTQYASIVTSTTTEEEEKTLDVKELPIQISDIAISPSKNQLFSIMQSGIRGLLSKIDGGSAVGIFSTNYR